MSRKDLNVATPRSGFAILMLIVVTGAAIVLAACGGDDEEGGLSPTANYLTQLSAVITLGNGQLQGLEGQYPTAFQEVDPTKEYYADYAARYQRFLEASEQIPVPTDIRDEHDEYIAAVQAVSQIFQRRLDELASATTIDEAKAILSDDPDDTAAVDRQKAACQALAAIAAAQGVNVPGLTECNKLP
jgi:hypothetical protein